MYEKSIVERSTMLFLKGTSNEKVAIIGAGQVAEKVHVLLFNKTRNVSISSSG